MRKVYLRRRIAVAVLLVAVFAFLFNATTPDQCKVPLDDMSSWCKDLLYP